MATATQSKGREYFERVSKLKAEGMTGQAAIAQVAKDMGTSAATVQTGYYRENRSQKGKKNGRRTAGRVVMPRPARLIVKPQSELDTLIGNITSAVDALRAYAEREASKVREIEALLA